MRTHEQIVADCDRRFEELKAEAERRNADPKLNYPCWTCRWFSRIGDDGYCTNPLVKGFRNYGVLARTFPMPCGHEKALWQPKLTLCQRIKALFA